MENVFTQISKWMYRTIEFVMVVCMAVMVVLVFTNAVMRYGFNSGLDYADELPRFAFTWLIFLGAIVALRERGHVGVDFVVNMLPLQGRKICWAITQIVVIIVGAYMFYGTFLQHEFLVDNKSTVAQIPDVYVKGISYVAGPMFVLIGLVNLVRLVLGRVPEEELTIQHDEGHVIAPDPIEARAPTHTPSEQNSRTDREGEEK